MQFSVQPQESRAPRTHLQQHAASHCPPRHHYLPGAYCSLAAVARTRPHLRLFAPTRMEPSLIFLVFVNLRGSRRKQWGRGWSWGAVLNRVGSSPLLQACSLPQRNLESALRRLAANWDGFVPDVCDALPPSLLPCLYCCF